MAINVGYQIYPVGKISTTCKTLQNGGTLGTKIIFLHVAYFSRCLATVRKRKSDKMKPNV